MKLIRRSLVSLLCVAFLVPFTAFWQEEASATVTCPGVFDVDITVVGTGKNKEQAENDLDDKIAEEVNAICSGSCIHVCIDEVEIHSLPNGGTCEAVNIETTGINCKYNRRYRSWLCSTTIRQVECD